MESLNQLLTKIRTVAAGNAFIRQTFIGPEFDIAADEAAEYPLLWVMPDGFEMDFEGGRVAYRFTAAVMDREQHDRSNQMEVLSDTAQIVIDLLNGLHYDYRASDVKVVCNDTAEPFIGDKTDFVAGHGISFSIEVSYTRDACAIP